MKELVIVIVLTLGLTGSALADESYRMSCGKDSYRTDNVRLWKNGKLVSAPPAQRYAAKGYTVKKHLDLPIFHVRSTIGSLVLRDIHVNFPALTVRDTPTYAQVGTLTKCRLSRLEERRRI